MPLCTEVFLENRYCEPISKRKTVPTSVSLSHIGIGSKKTWHGTRDARVRGGCSFSYVSENTECESDTDSDESDRMTSHLEGKLLFNAFNL